MLRHFWAFTLYVMVGLIAFTKMVLVVISIVRKTEVEYSKDKDKTDNSD